MESKTSDRRVESARDILVIALESARRRASDAITDITETEYHWEPLSEAERLADITLAPDRKKVWRVHQTAGTWLYDYTPELLDSPPFTTIAWLINHIAQTGDMYLYCIKTGKPEGLVRKWEDLPVNSDRERMSRYLLQVLDDTKEYLNSISEDQINIELNRLTPAPWGEMRPVYKNIWGGIIGHVLEHSTQISILKQRIRVGY